MSQQAKAETVEQDLPVMLSVTQEDGAVVQVRVGSALRSEQGLVLHLDTLTIAEPARHPEPVVPQPRARPASHATSVADLEYLAGRSRSTLADPAKARWHSEARDQLAHIEQEIARQKARLSSMDDPTG